MTKYIVAHDFGTSGNKSTLFTTEGKCLGSITVPYPTDYSNVVWAEQKGEDWWKAFCESTKTLLKDVDNKDVLCVNFDGHYPGCHCIDKDGNELYPAMIWQDMRAEAEAKEISAKTPNCNFGWRQDGLLNSVCTLPKLMWVRNNMPEIYEKTYKVLACPNDYIILKLTGKFAIDHTNAESTGFYDPAIQDWSDEILEAAGMSRDVLPEIHNMTDIIGEVPEKYAEETGLAAGTKVIMGCGDGPASSIGAGNIDPGDAYISGGSSAWVSGVGPGGKQLGGTCQTAGSSFSWLKNEICKIEQKLAEESNGEKTVFDIINEEVASAPVGSNGVMFLPHLMGERAPRWNPKAKGSFLGITLANTRADLLRAVVEGIVLNLNCILTEIRKEIDVNELIMIGGLAKGDVVRQIFADVMNAKIIKLKHMDEVASMGTAVIGGIAMGIFENERAVKKFHEVEAINEPNPEAHAIYEKIIPLFDKAYFCQVDLFEEMANLKL